ncbi:MAG: nucleoside deaminase, partial [Rectinema sp.]|nr:nucleoside deaminase [Rectinema sp.]
MMQPGQDQLAFPPCFPHNYSMCRGISFESFTREQDREYLRRAISLAESAVMHGNTPFGAILVGPDGSILLEQENIERTCQDCTAHAETALVRRASARFSKEFLAGCSLYTSVEPCAMCAG